MTQPSTEQISEQSLHPQQDYIFELASVLGYEPKVVTHDTATKTCYEKADLLGWDPEQVVKAVYFHKDDYVVGIITPELGEKIDIKDIIPRAIPSISRKKAGRFQNSYAPEGMAHGTCTPFPYESVMEDGIDKLIIIDHPTIDNKLVDISIGGSDEKAFKTSMHIPYKGIYDILKTKFGDRIEKV